MNTITKRTLKGNLYYKNSTILTYTINYPEIVSSPFDVKFFNYLNKKNALFLENYCKTELFSQAIEVYNYNTSNGYPIMIFEVVLDYTITYNLNNIISLYSDEYIFTGGAHGNTTRKSQNWDLITNKFRPLSYFFNFNEYYIINILKEINLQISKQLEENPSQYFDNYCQLTLENFRLNQYYLSQENIIIFFQQYDIAPYSSGIPTFKIPL